MHLILKGKAWAFRCKKNFLRNIKKCLQKLLVKFKKYFKNWYVLENIGQNFPLRLLRLIASGWVISRTRPRTFYYSIITVGRSWARKLKFAGHMDGTLTLVHKKFRCSRPNRKKNIWKKHRGHTFLKKGWLAACGSLPHGVISRIFERFISHYY